MSVIINNLTITSIVRDEGNFAYPMEPSINDVKTFSSSIVDKLTTLFNGSSGLRTGRFDDNEKPKFSKSLSKYLVIDTLEINEFTSLSKSLSQLLADELNQNQAKQAKDGFLLIYDYVVSVEDEMPQNYLCAVYLHRIDGVNINEKCNLEDIEQINLDSLNLGARISLQAYLEEENDTEERSILFKIGRGSQIRVFFQNFLGCCEPSDAKVDSSALLSAIDYACTQFQLSEEDRLSVITRVTDHCKSNMKTGIYQAELHILSGVAFNDDEQIKEFIQIAQDKFKLSESIGLEKSIINKYDEITVKTNGYRVYIKRSAMNKDITWDPDSEQLIITKLPQETKDQLNSLYSEQ